MEDMLNVAEAKTRLIQELSEITGFKYLKSGVLSSRFCSRKGGLKNDTERKTILLLGQDK